MVGADRFVSPKIWNQLTLVSCAYNYFFLNLEDLRDQLLRKKRHVDME